MQRPQWVTIPNLVTLVRVAMTPFILLQLGRGNYLVGGWMFGAAAATDILDGWLARRFGQRSLFGGSKAGQYFDPVADKLLLTSIYLGLAMGGAERWFVVWVIFARDLWILGLSGVALRFTNFRNLQPSKWGKGSTFAQIMAVVAVTAGRAYANADFTRVGDALLWVVVALAFLSGGDYTLRGMAWLRGGGGFTKSGVDGRVGSE